MKTTALVVVALLASAAIAAIFSVRSRIANSPDVYIVPFDNLPADAVGQWTDYLTDQMNLKFSVLTGVPYPKQSFNEQRNQYIAEALADSVNDIRNEMHFVKPNAVFIGLLRDDLYSAQHNWNYCFTLNFIDDKELHGISIISTALLSYSVPDEAQHIPYTRLYKLFKRAIGYERYGYHTSTNIGSVMFDGLNSLEVLDQMGTEYIDEGKYSILKASNVTY